MKLIRILVIFWPACFFMESAFSRGITTSDILDHQKTTVKAFDHIAMKTHEDITTYDKSSSESRIGTIDVKIRRDAEKFDYVYEQKWFVTDEKPIVIKSKYLWDGQQYIEYRPKSQWAFISKDIKRANESSRGSDRSRFLDGYFRGDDEHFSTILQKATEIKLTPSYETINGISCHLVEAKTPHGGYRIWFDPEHGYNIAKAIIHKSLDDIRYGKLMRDYKPYTGPLPGGKTLKNPEFPEECVILIDHVEFKKVDGVWVPIKAKWQQTEKYPSGREFIVISEFERIDIDFNPNFIDLGAFEPNLPDGTSLTLEYAPRKPYKWYNGKPTPTEP